MSTRPAASRRHLSTSPFAAPEPVVPTDYAVADRVCHERHGLGRVVAVEAGAIVVDFGHDNVVRVPSSSTRISRV